MSEPVKKKVDESWKEQAEREKREGGHVAHPQAADPGPAPAGEPPIHEPKAHEREAAEAEGGPQARFDLFVSGLAMEAFVALGDMPHPATRKQAVNLPQAKYLIDLLGVLEEKTRGNLLTEEEQLLRDALYQLRMRYLAKAGAGG